MAEKHKDLIYRNVRLTPEIAQATFRWCLGITYLLTVAHRREREAKHKLLICKVFRNIRCVFQKINQILNNS
jgi:hypothetical protein